MSLDLSIITDKKLTDEEVTSVIAFLLANRFYKDQYGYRMEAENISLDVYTDSDTENDDFWNDDPPKAVWFTPMTDIGLESRHNRESHEMNYRIAKELAKIVGGVIYDNQVGVVYDSDGQPCDHYGTGKPFEKYGAGIDLFMRGIGLFKDILESK